MLPQRPPPHPSTGDPAAELSLAQSSTSTGRWTDAEGTAVESGGDGRKPTRRSVGNRSPDAAIFGSTTSWRGVGLPESHRWDRWCGALALLPLVPLKVRRPGRLLLDDHDVPFAHVIGGKCRQPAVAEHGDLLGCQDRLQPFESCQERAPHWVTVDLSASSSSLRRRVPVPRAVSPESCALFRRTKQAAPDQLNQAPAARLYGTGGPANQVQLRRLLGADVCAANRQHK